MPPAITDVVLNDELLGFHLEDGRFISVPVAFYPTLALATPEERGRFEINGSSVHWPELDADIGVEGLLAGAREHHYYARKAVERAVRLGRLPKNGSGKNSRRSAATRLTASPKTRPTICRPRAARNTSRVDGIQRCW